MVAVRALGTLPNLIIIGAMKSGTTSLHYYLNKHPEIRMSRQKELDFFIHQANWSKGLEWYRSNFTGTYPVHGEASPNYTDYPLAPEVPERMYEVVPGAKLIYVVRDPIERLVSHYVHYYASGKESRELAEVATTPESSYIYRGKYFMQLEQFLRFYPQSSILVLDQHDLYFNRAATCRRVFEFLGIDSSVTHPGFAQVRFRGDQQRWKNKIGRHLTTLPGLKVLSRLAPSLHWHVERLITSPFSRDVQRPVLSEESRQQLIDHFQADINNLRILTGLQFESWCL